MAKEDEMVVAEVVNKIQESIELADLLEKAALKMNMKVDFLSYAQSKIAFQLMKPGHIRSKFL